MGDSQLAAGILFAILCAAGAAGAEDRRAWRFDFGRSTGSADRQAVGSEVRYDSEKGYGFEPSADLTTPADGGCVVSEKPIAFSVRLPEGRYHVTVHLGASAAASAVAIKAEARRVMSPLMKIKAGETLAASFAVTTRQPRVDDASSVNLADREKGSGNLTWDDKLTLEFVGNHIAIQSIDVTRADDTIGVLIAGDSTVTDQIAEPWAGWGQMLPQFFNDRVAVTNLAESGRSLRSFKAQRRWAKLLSLTHPGDFVLIQFGHNDMKEKGDGIGAFTSYAASLREYVADVRQRRATPVLVTPMNRRRFVNEQVVNTFGDYPDAVRQVAKELDVPLIDLFAMSKPLYESFGPEPSKQLFVHFPAGTFPGQKDALKDDTHFRAFGGDQIARCVVQAIRDLKLPLAEHIRDSVPSFDPHHPGDPLAYNLPPSASEAVVVPEGR